MKIYDPTDLILENDEIGEAVHCPLIGVNPTMLAQAVSTWKRVIWDPELEHGHKQTANIGGI